MNIIGLDLGTTTISAVVWESDTKSIRTSRTVQSESFLKGESYEKIQNPEWIRTKAVQVLDDLIHAYPEISGIGLTGQMHGILYLDEAGKPVSPLYTWEDQSGSTVQKGNQSFCDFLEERYGENFYTGYGIVTYLTHCINGKVPEKAVSFCTIGDYVGMVLTGRKKPLMHSSNAASLGFYEMPRGVFLQERIQECGGEVSMLPEVTDHISLLGTYRNIPVFTAIGDNQASFIGSVEDPAHSILVNMGTGGQISMALDHYEKGTEIETRPLGDGKYLLVGSSLCGGRAYALLEQFFRTYAEAMGIFGRDHYAVMDQLMREVSVSDEDGLHVETTFSGTRKNPDGTGSVSNIKSGNFTPKALIRGVLEGMAEELYHYYLQMQKLNDAPRNCLIASGNGLRKNLALQQIFEERFQMKLTLSPCLEEAACGAARSAYEFLNVVEF